MRVKKDNNNEISFKFIPGDPVSIFVSEIIQKFKYFVDTFVIAMQVSADWDIYL